MKILKTDKDKVQVELTREEERNIMDCLVCGAHESKCREKKRRLLMLWGEFDKIEE